MEEEVLLEVLLIELMEEVAANGRAQFSSAPAAGRVASTPSLLQVLETVWALRASGSALTLESATIIIEALFGFQFSHCCSHCLTGPSFS